MSHRPHRPTFATLADATGSLDVRRIKPRLSFERYRPFGRGASTTLSIDATVATVTRKTKDDHLRAVAYLIGGDTARALEYFGALNARTNDARTLNDYAAALLVRADEEDDPRYALDALVAAGRAVDSGDAAALFNRALALETLGLFGEARLAWAAAAKRDSDPQWKREAAESARRLALRQGAEDIGVRRRRAEGITLSEWADAVLRNDDHRASTLLADARDVASDIHRASGERLLRDAVAAIDGAGPADRHMLALAQVSYRAGRLAHRANKPVEAERQFRYAARTFERVGSPMAYLARYFIGSALHAQSRLNEARELLDALAAKRLEDRGYLALAAQIGWERGLARFSGGSLAEPLQIFEGAREHAIRAGDHDLAAQLDLLAVQVLDAMGDARGAWQRRRRVFSALYAARNEARTVVALNAAASVLLRLAENARAGALLGLSIAASDRLRDPMSAAWAYTTRSAIVSDPWRDLAAAQRRLVRVDDATTRARLQIDFDLARGIALRRRDPSAAIDSISRALAAVERTGAGILAPRLWLERGLTHEQQDDHQRALDDFARGIDAVERQRASLSSPEQRATILATAEKLFDGAIGAALATGDAAQAFTFVERARARTLFEQIDPQHEAHTATAVEIREALAADAAVISYWTFPDRVAAFVLTRGDFRVVTTRVPADRLQRANPAQLYRFLIAPLALVDVRLVAFIAGGALANVQFAGLYDEPASEFAIDRFAVVQAPSASVAVSCARRARGVPGGRTLVVGASEFDRAANPQALPLPWVAVEARLVAKQLDARLLDGAAATPSSFLRELPHAGTLHFAGHAIADQGDPESGRLLLAPEGERSAVAARDIAALRLPRARLVVLAACSAARRTRGIDGVDSIAAAFLAAGVPMVVAASADVDDRLAASFSRRFHAALARGAEPAAALRDALRAEAATDRSWSGHAAPQWARIVLTGGTPGLVD